MLLLVAVLTGPAFAQKIIRLKYDPVEPGQNPYTLVRPADSLYIRFDHSEDMGVPYSFRYELNEPVPDGAYEIYRNDTLELRGTIDKGRKEGEWTRFYREEYVITTYAKGLRNGYVKVYTLTQRMKGLSYFKDDKMVWGEQYDKAGKISQRLYWIDGTLVREEKYNKGKLLKVDEQLKIQEKDGKMIRQDKTGEWVWHRFKTGTFKVLLKQNKIVAWKLYNSDGILQAEGKGR